MSDPFNDWWGKAKGEGLFLANKKEAARLAWDASRAEGDAKLREFGQRLRGLAGVIDQEMHLQLMSVSALYKLANEASQPEEANHEPDL